MKTTEERGERTGEVATGARLLRCSGLEVGYGGRAILPPIDLDIEAGQFWAVIGRNGAGKTSWFRTLLGLLPPVRGHVERARHDLRVSHIPQRAQFDELFPARARDVVGMGADRGLSFLVPRVFREPEMVRHALEDVQALEVGRERFSSLSEGQKQRVLLARLVASRPHVALLDEPTAAMDVVAEHEAFSLIDALRRRHGITVVVVSHHLEVAWEFADHALLLDREHHLAVSGPPRQVLSSEAFVKSFGNVERLLHA